MPTKRLNRERLEERILNLLSSQNMCVLATVGPDDPLATPVRYYSLGFAVLFTAGPRSPTMRIIAADPRVSVGIFAPLVGLASSRGVQVFGTAKVLGPSILTARTTGRRSDGRTSTQSAGVRCPNRPRTRSWSLRRSGLSTPSTGCGVRDSHHASSGFAEMLLARSWEPDDGGDEDQAGPVEGCASGVSGGQPGRTVPG